jgi:hypothetical protein
VSGLGDAFDGNVNVPAGVFDDLFKSRPAEPIDPAKHQEQRNWADGDPLSAAQLEALTAQTIMFDQLAACAEEVRVHTADAIEHTAPLEERRRWHAGALAARSGLRGTGDLRIVAEFWEKWLRGDPNPEG